MLRRSTARTDAGATSVGSAEVSGRRLGPGPPATLPRLVHNIACGHRVEGRDRASRRSQGSGNPLIARVQEEVFFPRQVEAAGAVLAGPQRDRPAQLVPGIGSLNEPAEFFKP